MSSYIFIKKKKNQKTQQQQKNQTPNQQTNKQNTQTETHRVFWIGKWEQHTIFVCAKGCYDECLYV